MDTIFMNSEKSKTSKPYMLKLMLTDKLDLRLDKKVIALSNLSIYYTWNNIKISYNNNKFKISPPTWNDEFELLDGSYSVSDIQDCFGYILKKHGEKINNDKDKDKNKPSVKKYINKVDKNKPSVKIYINKVENRITFKIKNGYSLELLSKETMKLLGSTEIKKLKIKMKKMCHILKLQK